jgi:hypothetical protein
MPASSLRTPAPAPRSPSGKVKTEVKLKSAVQLQEFLDVVRLVFADSKGAWSAV